MRTICDSGDDMMLRQEDEYAFVTPAARLSALLSLQVIDQLLVTGKRQTFARWARHELVNALNLGLEINLCKNRALM